MTLPIIDKRIVSRERDRTTENRQRFLRRIRETIKEQLPDIIKGKSLRDIDSEGGQVKVKRKTVREPWFHHDYGGNVDRVLPGNDEFVEGDEISKPKGQKGKGSKASPDGEGEDDFVVELSREEFLDFFFEDLALPDMIRVELAKLKESHRENAGYSVDGSPNRLAILKSYKQSLARRIPLINMYNEEIDRLRRDQDKLSSEKPDDWELTLDSLTARLNELEKKRNLPLFEEMDLRYRSSIKREVQSLHATMVMIMDNSGSMTLHEKTISRKFFWLLYSFLKRVYDQVDMVFISHTTVAHEMDEEEFFNTYESGGTIVSSALELTQEIIQERLIGKTNIYVAQASDGDNWSDDNSNCSELLREILTEVRYFAYIQVNREYTEDSVDSSELWETYNQVAKNHQNLQMRNVLHEQDIYPVFRELFKKR